MPNDLEVLGDFLGEGVETPNSVEALRDFLDEWERSQQQIKESFGRCMDEWEQLRELMETETGKIPGLANKALWSYALEYALGHWKSCHLEQTNKAFRDFVAAWEQMRASIIASLEQLH